MINFDKATEIITEYKKLRLKRDEKDKFNLHGKLKEIGYTEAEYYREIDLRYLKNSNIVIKEITPDSLLNELNTAITTKTNTVIFCKPTSSVVYTGKSEFNEDFCKANNIPIFKLGYSGGTIVTTDKDLGIGFVLDKPNMLRTPLFKINEWITKNFSDGNIEKISENHNDIMVENYKVLGCAEVKIGEMNMSYYQVSFDVNIDLIKSICTKKMEKHPMGLSAFGKKTREDLIEEIKIWLQK